MSQDRPVVDVFTRHSDGRWLLYTAKGLVAEAVFESIDCQVPPADIYDKVDLAPADGASV